MTDYKSSRYSQNTQDTDACGCPSTTRSKSTCPYQSQSNFKDDSNQTDYSSR